MEKDRAIDVEETPVAATITSTTTAPSPPRSPASPSEKKDDLRPPPSLASTEADDGDDDDDDDDNEGPYTYGDLERGLSADHHASDPDLAARNVLTHIRTGTSICSAASRPPDYEVVFEPGDPEDPRNWPVWYRGWTLAVLSYSNWVVVLYSTSYTASIPGLTREFGVTTPIATLGLTTYLLGLAVGSLIVAPLSELYGRQSVYLGCMAAAVLLVIPCGLAKSLTEMIVIRFFG